MPFKRKIDLLDSILFRQPTELGFRTPVTATVQRKLRCIIHQNDSLN
jgi:hypothetical protein